MDQVIEFATNHYILSAVFAGLVIALIYSFFASALSPLKEITTHEATLLINKQDAVVLDVRPVAEFKKGHILGSKQVKSELLTKGDFTSLEKHKGTPIIVVCNMGMTAKRTASQMLKAGFENVTVLKGGISAWQGANLPTAK
ncbi:MAG: rhodanese-like domain-containing protein [Paraglaciecola sp.]|uniref:rhodanese-like domain-containing protein n=1 Tax=Flavobacterium sp. W21_SRS_FM6 TaxID=3240268 RepID=UPI002747873D|nr:rhodanese-like domain-containing protein [Paraglaciecola sp.]MDP5133317.1 rhodanese-like domain-containing protein [Paraglaciecola sp.]